MSEIPKESGMRPQLVVNEGDTVVFDENGEKKAFIKIRAKGTVKMGKSHVPMTPFIGAPYGSVFTLSADGKTAERVLECPVGEWAAGMTTTTTRTNQGLFDRNEDNQKLSAEEIAAMKASGKGGTEIVEALCANSATFQQKTEFAQEKYKRKKARKYVLRVTLRRPTARTICEAYFEKGSERIAHLRPDTLAIMLSLANVAAGAKVLVLDSVMGVVNAAVAERLGGHGVACMAYTGKPGSMDACKSLNLNPHQQSALCSAALSMLVEVKALGPELPAEFIGEGKEAQGAGEAGAAPGSTAAAASADGPATELVADKAGAGGSADAGQQQGGGEPMEAEGAGAAGAAAEVGGEAAQPAVEGTGAEGANEAAGAAAAAQGGDKAVADNTQGGDHKGGRKGKGPQQAGAGGALGPRTPFLHSLVHPGFTSVIIALPRCDPTSLMTTLWPLLAPSATFALYMPTAQPLAECLHHLRSTHQAVMLQLQESWMRPYQVLPARTHPHMTCSGTGGFILSGIKVVAGEDRPSPAPVTPRGGRGGKQQQQKQKQQAKQEGAQAAAPEAAAAEAGKKDGEAAAAAAVEPVAAVGDKRTHEGEGAGAGAAAGEGKQEGGEGEGTPAAKKARQE